MRQATVLGGGVAGIAAAFALRDRGFRVRLLESRRGLGGRVFSFADDGLGEVDNGPHVMLGCYDHMRALLRRIGTECEFERCPTLTVAYRLRGGRRAELRLPRLPVPFAMPLALLRLPLGANGRFRALRGLLGVVRGAEPSWTLEEWVLRRRQEGGPAAFFWGPLCRAVMNAEPDLVSAELFLGTLRRAFSGGAARGAIWIPRRPWGRIVGEAAERRLREEGVAVECGVRITGLWIEGGRVAGLSAGGRTFPVAEDEPVVSALPWHALARLLDGDGATLGGRLRGSPLVSVYFEVQGDAPADEGPLVGLVEGQPFHFLYRTPGDPPERFALLAGGCRELDGLPVARIEELARRQVAEFYPEWSPRTPAHVRVTKEARATFVASPEALADRPPPGPLSGGPDNLSVCGDWTDCGLPSTLEGAAASAGLMMDRLPVTQR